MTEQEAEALAARLTRVWEPEGEIKKHSLSSRTLRFDCWIKGNELHLHHSYDPHSRKTYLDVRLYCGSEAHLTEAAFLHFVSESSTEVTCFNSPLIEDQSRFVADWLPFFRRGCWLSGCPIEASAHEKAEWIQGFTREEIETWNLMM